MATNPRTWIYQLIDLVPGFLSRPARWIADRIFSVLDDGVEFAKWLKSGFDYLRSKGVWFADHLRLYALETLYTVQWLTGIRIPALIANAVSTLHRWVTSAINAATKVINAALHTLDKWAKAAVSGLTNALNSVRDWFTKQINALLAKIHATIDKWYDRLTNPGKMAEWLIGALMGPLWRYVYANRDKITRWFLRSSPGFVEWLARELDKILGRIL